MVTNAKLVDRIINDLQQALGRGGVALFKSVPTLVASILRDEDWRQCKDKTGKPFASFDAFVRHPLQQGLDTTPEYLARCCENDADATRLLREAVPLTATHAEAGAKGGRGKKAPDIVRSFGNDPTYALARLKRDRPDLAALVIAGTLSANAAAIKAGFRKQPSGLELLRRAWKKASDDERRKFIDEVS